MGVPQPMNARTFRPPAGLIVTIALVVSACGADAEDQTSPTIASPRLAGIYTLDELTVQGSNIETSDTPSARFELETEFGGLVIDTDCGSFRGAFSLFDNGQAGMTVTGGSTADCAIPTATAVNALMEAVSTVDSWENPSKPESVTDKAVLNFAGSDGSSLVLVRQP